MTTTILERQVYGISEAAGLLGLPVRKVRAWLDGYESRGKRYEPVVRAEHTGDEIVTWGEFVELGFLREYRKKDVPLQRLRPVIVRLRDELGTLYPLAATKPEVYNKELVLRVQEESGLPPVLGVVIRSGQTVAFTHEMECFLQKVTFPDDNISSAVQKFSPAGKDSPVEINPLVRFGRPAVAGIATERIWELRDAGETVEEIADGYDIDRVLIVAALTYEVTHRSVAA